MNSIQLLPTNSEPDPTADLTRSNPPALPVLTYRGGKYKPTVQRMLAQLSTMDALARLNRDAYDDWSIAVVHAWSIVTDVLAFYQERITNEGYIRTASERRSVLSLARALGYDWRPGLAADVDLALTVAPDDQEQPQLISVPKGSAIQSTPIEGKLPEVFETSANSEVRTEWNLLFPYVGLQASAAGENEPLLTEVTSMRVANYRNDLQKGDVILLVDMAEETPPPNPDPPTPVDPVPSPNSGLGLNATDGEPAPAEKSIAPRSWVLGTLSEVVADPQKPYTILRWIVDDHVGTEIKQPALFVFRQKALLFGYAQGAVYFDSEEAPPADGTSTATTTPTMTTPTTTTSSGLSTGNGVTPDTATINTSNPEPGSKTDTGDNATLPPPRIANWTPRTLSLPSQDINAFIVNSKGSIFAGTKSDLYRSLDNGTNWQSVAIDPVRRNVTALTLDPGDNLIAGSSTGGTYISYDNGDNWTPLSGDSVAPAVKVNKPDDKTFEVKPPDILPKAPVLELEFGKDRSGKTVLYALAGKQVFYSNQEGKGGIIGRTWLVVDEPNKELPATQKRLTAEDQRAAMLSAANGILTATRLQWLEKIAAPVAKGIGLTKWAGLDIWDTLRSSVGAAPEGSNAVNALAVSTQGKKSIVVVGTDAGKFTLKEKTRRWMVVAFIVLLVLLKQFWSGHGALSSSPVDIGGSGELHAIQTPVSRPDSKIMAKTDLTTQGTVRIDPSLAITLPTTYIAVLRGSASIAASLDDKQTSLVAGGDIPFVGILQATDETTASVELAGITTFTATVDGKIDITNTIYAITATEAVSVDITLIASALVTPSQGIWPPQITFSDIKLTGKMEPAPALPIEPRFPWLSSIWQQVADLLQTTVIASWNGIKDFLSAFWGALPGWVQAILTPINDYLIQPVIKFVDVYLIRPLLSYTAKTLLDISAITLAVLALLLAWIYADRKMSNRKAVKLVGPVNALAIHPNGQIFAGTEQGIFRSISDDPNASWWTKATRLLIRQAFPDAPMEPINYGLTASEADSPPEIRSLSFTNTGALLAGTADGLIFRLSDPVAELDPNLQTPSTDPNTPPPAKVQWERYDQGIVQDDKSSLKSVRTIVATPIGQFVSGAVGTSKVEDRWFTAQVKDAPTTDNPQRRLGEIDLDVVYPNLQIGSWLLLRQPTGGLTAQGTPAMKYAHYQVVDVQRVRSQDFVSVGEFTRAFVEDEGRLTTFSRTKTEVLIQSEPITLFDNRPVAGDKIYLNGYVPDLGEGKRLIINGKEKLALTLVTMPQALWSDNGLEARTLEKGQVLKVLPTPKTLETLTPLPKCDPTQNLCPWRLQTTDGFVGTVLATSAQIRWIYPTEDDPIISEVVTLRGSRTWRLDEEAALQSALDYAYDRVTITQLDLISDLQHVYDRATVTLFGNVLAATHGKTVEDEILGSGNGMQPNERFMLKEGPLTYVSAVNEQGAESQITVKVNEIEWQKQPYLYGLARDQRAYIVRQDALDNSVITFGDGKQGARLPTGTERVTASYRIGIGENGNVPAYTVDQPQTLPSDIRRVTNPLPATGGVGPDSIEDVRVRTPLSVRVMDRIVALSDYEDYVRLYAGIGRVQLKKFGSGQALLLHFTVADASGNTIPPNATLIANLLTSIDERRATPTPQLQIDSYEQLYFDVSASLLIYPEHTGRAQVIAETIQQKLLSTFCFERRNFGQDVAESEVVALIQNLAGVAVVDSVNLQDSRKPLTSIADNPNERMVAQLARMENGTIRPAQLLLLNPGLQGVVLQIATTSEPTKLLWNSSVKR